LRFGLQAHSSRIMTLGNYRLDQWILGTLSTSRELGLYSVAVAWGEALYYLPTALDRVQRPSLVRAASERDAAGLAAAVFRGTVVLTIPLAAAVIVAAPVLCVTVFGEEFRGSIDDLRVLAAGAFGIIALKLLGNALTARGRPLLVTAGVGIAFIATVTLDLILIPSYGGLGAAIASAVAYTAGGLTLAVLFARALATPLRGLVPRVADVARVGVGVRALIARRN
jgi:O-antigen/teichoic acid export membrane protein